MNGTKASRLATRLLRPRSPQDVMLRPLEIGVAVIAVLGFQKMLGNLATAPSGVAGIGLLALLVVHLLVALECLRPIHLSWPITLLAAGGLLLVVAGESAFAGTQTVLWNIDAWVGVPLAFLAVIHPRGLKLPLLLTITVICLLVLNATHRLDWSQHILPTIFLATSLALLLLARRVMVTLVDEQVASLEARQRDAAQQATVRAADDSVSMLRRAMHDSLLHSLQRIGSLWQSSTPAQLRAAAAETRLMLATVPDEVAGPGDPSLAEALRDSVAAEPCTITWDGRDAFVPPLVREAIHGAVREAVRNVVKHCDVAAATVTIEPTIQGVRVSVRDGGPGFDLRTALNGRSGIRDSVIGRMQGVGGAVEYTTSAGGTTVDIEWPARPHAVPPLLGRKSREALAWTPLPLVIGSLASAMTFPAPNALLSSLFWASLVALLLVAAHALVERGLTDREAWLMCMLGLAALIANYAWVEPGASGWAIWVPSLTTSFMILAMPGRSARTATAIAIVMVVGALLTSIIRLGVTATLGSQFGAFMAVLTNALVTLVLAFGAAGISQHVLVTRQLAAAALQRAQDAAERAAMWRDWLRRATILTGPFLMAVETGRLDPADPETRREAGWLEARVRDELSLWPVQTDLPEMADRMRRRGWRVRLDVDGLDEDAAAALAEVLGAVPPPVSRQELTIARRGRGAVLTFSNPGLSNAQLAPVRSWATNIDPDFTQLQVGGSPATSTRRETE